MSPRLVLPLRREAPDAEALEEDTVRAEKEAALVGDEREGRRRSLMGAGPLLGQLHSLPSVEAERTERDVQERSLICMNITKPVILHQLYCVFIDKHKHYSPCVGVEAVKGQTGSKE